MTSFFEHYSTMYDNARQKQKLPIFAPGSLWNQIKESRFPVRYYKLYAHFQTHWSPRRVSDLSLPLHIRQRAPALSSKVALVFPTGPLELCGPVLGKVCMVILWEISSWVSEVLKKRVDEHEARFEHVKNHSYRIIGLMDMRSISSPMRM